MEDLIRHLCDVQALAKFVGTSPALLKTIERLPAIAKSEAPVLVTGETGTGKELVARALHYLSKRAAFPLVPVNCGALPDTLSEDELFGHERGAFTDAYVRRVGLIAEADGGTLFLDEVDALPPKAQVDLLRVLQQKVFRAVGSSKEQEIDVRVVAASNAALGQLVRLGSFRADLYYRLDVFSINLLPLRDRKEDTLLLADYFLKKHAPPDKARLNLAPSACAALISYDWPGNVRELESAIIRGIHLTQTDWIEIDDLELKCNLADPPGHAYLVPGPLRPLPAMKREVVEMFEKTYLTRLMIEYGGNVSEAARIAGKERSELGRLLKKYHLDPKLFRCPGTHATR